MKEAEEIGTKGEKREAVEGAAHNTCHEDGLDDFPELLVCNNHHKIRHKPKPLSL